MGVLQIYTNVGKRVLTETLVCGRIWVEIMGCGIQQATRNFMAAFFTDGTNIWTISFIAWIISLIPLYFIFGGTKTNLAFVVSMLVSLAICMGSGCLIANKVDPGWNSGEEMCGNCQTLIDEDASFCFKCGFENHPVCDACGARLEEAAEFCSACGEKVKG